MICEVSFGQMKPLPQNPKTPYVSEIRSCIYEQVSAAHSERHHISELNIDFIKNFQIGMGPPAADRRLLENKNQFGMVSWHRLIARDVILASIGFRRVPECVKAVKPADYWAPPQNSCYF